MLDPSCCAQLQRIHEATGAVIWLSTAWSICESVEDIAGWLRARGVVAPVMGEILGKVEGVEEWLRENEPERWVYIEDAPFDSYFPGHFVRTSWADGLTAERADLAISVLLGEGRP